MQYETSRVIEDTKLYNIRELFDKFGVFIPAYRWYVVNDIEHRPHIFTIVHIIPDLDHNDVFRVGLSIMDWEYNSHQSTQKSIYMYGHEEIMINLNELPHYRQSAIRGAENEDGQR